MKYMICKKMIKKFLILILLVLLGFVSIAQNFKQKSYKKIVENNCINYYQTLVDRTGFVYEWG